MRIPLLHWDLRMSRGQGRTRLQPELCLRWTWRSELFARRELGGHARYLLQVQYISTSYTTVLLFELAGFRALKFESSKAPNGNPERPGIQLQGSRKIRWEKALSGLKLLASIKIHGSKEEE